MKTIRKVWGAFDGLATDTIWGGAYDAFSLITTLISFILLQEVLTEAKYGSYGSMYALLGPVGALAFAGPGLALVQRSLRYKDEPNQVFRQYFSLTLWAGGILTILVVLFGALITKFLSLTEIILLVFAELIGNAVVFTLSRLLQASSGFPAMARINIGFIAIKLTTLIVLASTDQRLGAIGWPQMPFFETAESLTIRNLGIGYCVGYVTYAAWLLRFHMGKHGYKVAVSKPEIGTVKEGAVFSIPMAASQLQANGDKIALEAFRGGRLANGEANPEVGVYNAAYRIVMLGLFPLWVLDSAAFQRFLPDNDEKGVHLERSKKFAGLMFVVAVALAGMLYLAQPLVRLILAEKFEEPVLEIMPWLLLFIPLVALSGTPMNGLLGLGREKERSYVYLSSSAVSICFYLALIPKFGWQGAVAATILSELYLTIVSWVAIVHYQRVADREIDDRLAQTEAK